MVDSHESLGWMGKASLGWILEALMPRSGVLMEGWEQKLTIRIKEANGG